MHTFGLSLQCRHCSTCPAEQPSANAPLGRADAQAATAAGSSPRSGGSCSAHNLATIACSSCSLKLAGTALQAKLACATAKPSNTIDANTESAVQDESLSIRCPCATSINALRTQRAVERTCCWRCARRYLPPPTAARLQGGIGAATVPSTARVQRTRCPAHSVSRWRHNVRPCALGAAPPHRHCAWHLRA